MLKRLFMLALACGSLTAGSLRAAEPAPAQPQTKCPIKGGDIDPKVYVDYHGKRIFFCCPGCDEKFLAKADEHIAKMEASGVQLAKAPPALCPVSGEEVDPEITYVHAGKTYTFCCKRCVSKFKKEPAKYLKAEAKAEDHGAMDHDAKANAHEQHSTHNAH